MKIMKRGKASEGNADSQKGAGEQGPAGKKKDARIQALEPRIDVLVKANEQMAKEFKDIRQRLETFKGLEEVQKMARDTAKDLLAMKTVQSRIDADSGKVEKMFADMQKKYAEMQKLKGVVGKLTESVTSSTKDVSGMKEKMANLPDRGQMEEIKKALKDKADSFSKGQAIDPKAMKEFLNRSVSLERDIGTLKVRFDKMLNVMDMFTERLNAAQKDILALKQARPAAKGPVQAMPQELAGKIADAEKGLKDIQGLKERVGDIEEALERTVSPERKPGEMNELRGRIEEIEDILEKVTERLKSASPGKIPQPPVDAREMRTIMERIMKLEAAMKAGTASQAPIPPELKDARQLTDRLERIETTIKDMRERLAAVDDDIAKFAEKQPQPPQEPDQNALRPANERLDSLDSRIAGISDKLMQVSGDCQKLSDYLMEGMKHMEEKIRGMENLVKAEDKMISSLGSKQVEVFRPTTYRSHLRQPHPDYYSPPSQAQRQPRPSPIQPAPFQALPPGILPPPPAPPRGNVFTKLRDGTVIRRPYARPEPDSDDVEIIMEHILESMRRRESRDKITRDLMNAGYDLEIIDKAFMQARVG